MALDRRAVGVGDAAVARWYTKTNVCSSPPGRLSSSTATLVDSALAGRVSAALSVVTELNFPLSGTMNAASTIQKPITNHGTHRPANRPTALPRTALR